MLLLLDRFDRTDICEAIAFHLRVRTSAGLVKQSFVERAAGNVLRAKFAAGLFDQPIWANER